MEVDKVCFACFERLKKSKSQKLRSLTGNHGTFQDMKTSLIFSNSSEPEAGILQEIQPQVKVLGATVGSSLDSRILKFKHLNWSWKGREPFFICNNAFQACWLCIVLYFHTKTNLFRRNEFLRCQPHQGYQPRWLPIKKKPGIENPNYFCSRNNYFIYPCLGG